MFANFDSELGWLTKLEVFFLGVFSCFYFCGVLRFWVAREDGYKLKRKGKNLGGIGRGLRQDLLFLFQSTNPQVGVFFHDVRGVLQFEED